MPSSGGPAVSPVHVERVTGLQALWFRQHRLSVLSTGGQASLCEQGQGPPSGRKDCLYDLTLLFLGLNVFSRIQGGRCAEIRCARDVAPSLQTDEERRLPRAGLHFE